ncbi:hypothetical protein Pla163_17770 [Planctomycetes bacterium Pla163]|jgi:hypothetical protein|uniref:DUF4956 domain-containing protein n=1 Tax=Rohdeia mirabilis TaxID=2528008 RepID=A0A518CZP5_9BACT|nr:hypothetical protein Pla163_17770 [Planctomycetes bacterium Pla163]
MNWSQLFDSLSGDSTFQNLDLPRIFVNLAVALVLSQILAWHYVRFSRVLSNKVKFARVFVFVAATTMLVISVVQTSLALSLGLVGALSIIRFRTPIKEPEELAYLFLAVAIGVGVGANEGIITTVVVLTILLYLGIAGRKSSGALPPRVMLHVSCQLDGTDADTALRQLQEASAESAGGVDLRRLDVEGSTFNANLVLDRLDPGKMGSLVGSIQKALPGSAVSIVEAGSLD